MEKKGLEVNDKLLLRWSQVGPDLGLAQIESNPILSIASNLFSIGHSFDIDYDHCWWYLQLVLVNPLAEVIEKLHRADEAGDFRRPDSLFLTVGEAVAVLSSTMKGSSSTHAWLHKGYLYLYPK